MQGHEKVSAYLNNASAGSLLPPPGFSMTKPVGSVSLPHVSACPAATAVSSLPLPYSQVSNGPAAGASLPNCLMSSVIGNSSANIKNSCPMGATSILPSGVDSDGPATAGLSPHVSHFRPEVPGSSWRERLPGKNHLTYRANSSEESTPKFFNPLQKLVSHLP